MGLVSILAFANQSFTQLIGILQVGVKMLVTIFPLVLFLEYGHGITRIVGELLLRDKRPYLHTEWRKIGIDVALAIVHGAMDGVVKSLFLKVAKHQ